MQTEMVNIQKSNEAEVKDGDQHSVCNTVEEQYKLQKLFEILIKVDRRLNLLKNADVR